MTTPHSAASGGAPHLKLVPSPPSAPPPPAWHVTTYERPLVALCGERFTDDDSEEGGPGGSSPGPRCVVCDDLAPGYLNYTWSP